jgi:hypothetical protein
VEITVPLDAISLQSALAERAGGAEWAAR